MVEFQSPIAAPAAADLGSCRLLDESPLEKWRVWEDKYDVSLGTGRRHGDSLAFAVSPGEWIVIGARPTGADVVDLTHVRAAFRLTGAGARSVLEQMCALDLGGSMTPNGAAARTLVAGVATELIRDDVAGEPSYRMLMSRSFARSVWQRLVAAGTGS
jgi:heterotetrameric sarcosine oxidase gamma subunit